MASELYNARSNFSNLGSSLQSIQQNALDDQMSNNAALQNYNSVSAQLKASIPSSFGELAFGAYEFLGQGKDLLGRLSKIKSDIAAAPDAIKASLVKGGNRLGASLEEGKNIISGSAADLKQTASQLTETAKDITNRGVKTAGDVSEEIKNTANDLGGNVRQQIPTSTELLESEFREYSPGRYISPSGRIAPPPPAISEGITASLETEGLPKFTLPETVKRPTTAGFADSLQPENIRQQALRMVEPEEAEVAASSYLKPVEEFNPLVESMQRGDFMRGLTPESLITRPDEAILPTRLAGLQEGASTGLANISAAGKGAQQAVTTSLESATQKGGALANEALTTASESAGKVASTLSGAATAATDVGKAALGGIAETAAEVSSSFLPIVGEVTAVALGGVQIYEGFKDLFDHPSIAKPVTVAMPSTANIAQGFQSGI